MGQFSYTKSLLRTKLPDLDSTSDEVLHAGVESLVLLVV